MLVVIMGNTIVHHFSYRKTIVRPTSAEALRGNSSGMADGLQNPAGFFMGEGGSATELAGEGIFVDPGEAGELRHVEERGKAMDFLGRKVWLRDRIAVFSRAGNPKIGGIFDVAGSFCVGLAVGDAPAQGRDGGNIGVVFIGPVDFDEVFHGLCEEFSDLFDVSGFDFVAVSRDANTPPVGVAVDLMAS